MGAKKNQKGDAGKKDDGTTTVVLKVDMHCEGCASKIVKYLRAFQGVEAVKAESNTGKVTVSGKVDPTKVRDNLAEKIKKKVELISPQPKKEKENKDTAETNNNKPPEKITDGGDKKPKDNKQAATTAVLKVALHCQGCSDKIAKNVLKTKGVEEMSIDKEKDTITVKGTMDVKALVGNLAEKHKRKVEVVPPKKDKEEGAAGGDKKKNKGGEGGGDNSNNDKDEGPESKLFLEHNMRGYLAPAAPFGFGGYGYGYNNNGYGPYGGGYNYGPPPVPVHPEQFHHFHHLMQHQPQHQPPPVPPHQMFSDENPNACSVM